MRVFTVARYGVLTVLVANSIALIAGANAANPAAARVALAAAAPASIIMPLPLGAAEPVTNRLVPSSPRASATGE